MKAALLKRYGGPEMVSVGEIARPAPGENEIVVQVHAASLTLPDCAMRKGEPFLIRFFSGFLRPKNPVLGSDFSGVVSAVGRSVTRFAVGDAVFGATAASGAHAQYLLVSEDSAIVHKPDGVSHAEAAGLSYSYLTAMPFLREGGSVQPGDEVLIIGAAGSIGLIAVQLAKHLGARVTAVCSGRNSDLVRSVGADTVIDRRQADFTAAQNQYDVIFDVVGKSSYARCRAALKPRGRYLTTVPSFGILVAMLMTRQGPQCAKMMTTGLKPVSEKLASLAILVELIGLGAVRTVIDRRFDLAEIAEAHRYVEGETKAGDVVIELAP